MNKIASAIMLAALLTSTPAWSQQGWDLQQLMTSLAQVPSHESKFTEKKTVSLLKDPVESSGTLVYRRPDHLEKHVLQPKEEDIVVDGNELLWKDASGHSRSMRLSGNANLAALAESVRATLAGDLNGLQKYFSVKLDGSQAQWKLTLTPIDEAMQRKILGLSITGSGNRVDTVDVQEKSGDTSLMTIQHE